jgi:HEAT repeat protein
MAQPATRPAPALPAALERAFKALQRHDHGSPRGALQPIDDAVGAVQNDPALRAALESRLVTLLGGGLPAVATAFACRVLGSIGSATAVPALAALLDHPQLGDPARRALEAVPDPEAVRALRDQLPRLTGLARVGVIQSLGQRRDTAATRSLAALLAGPDPAAADAAAWALGEIASAAAGRALRRALPRAAAGRRPALHDAALACATRRRADGDRADAKALAAALLENDPPDHVRRAAERLRGAAG